MFKKNLVEEKLKNRKIVFALRGCENERFASKQMWYPPLKKLFREVILFDPRKRELEMGFERMWEQFLNMISKEKPDYILSFPGWKEFDMGHLKILNERFPKVKIIAFFGDDDILFENYSRYQILFFDYGLIGQTHYVNDYRKDGAQNVFPLVTTNTDNYSYMNLEKKYDVSFIGRFTPERAEIIRLLIKRGINVKIFGKGWKENFDLKDFCEGPVDSGDLVRIINETKINLNFTNNSWGEPHLKGRVFEVASCNSFQLSEYFSGYLEYFKENKELVTFKDPEELLNKIKYFLVNDFQRINIAKRAYKKVRKFNLDYEFRVFFEEVLRREDENKGVYKCSRVLPPINKKIVYLKKAELRGSFEDVKERVKKFDYVGFIEEGTHFLEKKDYLQMYSLEKTNKKISCCDFSVYSKGLEDYLCFSSLSAFRNISREEFYKILKLSQLVISKDFFINNFDKFRRISERKEVNLIDKDNTAFVSIPLIRVLRFRKLRYKSMVSAFCMNQLIVSLYSLFYRKNFFSRTSFKYFIDFLFKGNFFIFRYCFESLLSRQNWQLTKTY
jgi:spore maturation protein CgeB